MIRLSNASPLTDGPPALRLQGMPIVDVRRLSKSLLPDDPQFLDQLFRQFHVALFPAG